MRNICRECSGTVIEIDRYGHQLVGCIKCNLWKWRDSRTDRILMRLPNEDLEALERPHDTRARELEGET